MDSCCVCKVWNTVAGLLGNQDILFVLCNVSVICTTLSSIVLCSDALVCLAVAIVVVSDWKVSNRSDQERILIAIGEESAIFKASPDFITCVLSIIIAIVSPTTMFWLAGILISVRDICVLLAQDNSNVP